MKRRMRQIALFLLLGAIVNVAVAWACVVIPKNKSLTENSLPAESSNWPLNVPADWPAEPFQSKMQSSFARDELRAMGEVSARPGESRIAGIYYLNVKRSGLPFRSMASLNRHCPGARNDGPSDSHFSAYVPQDFPYFRRAGGSNIPLRPLMPGFLVNSVMYAIALWAVFVMPRQLRRAIRRRRGLCPACAYPIGVNDKCTECGVAVNSIAQ